MSSETNADDGVASWDSSEGGDAGASTDGTRTAASRSRSRRAVLAATTGAVAALGVGAASARERPGSSTASVEDGSAGTATPSSWPMDGFDLRNTRFPRDASAPTSNLQELWSFDVSVDQDTGEEYKTGRIDYAPPTIADGTVLIGDGALRSDRNYLHAIDADSGEQVWRKSMPTMNTAVTVGEGRVFAAGNASFVVGVDLETGTELWKWGTGERVRSSPKYHDGSVYVGCDDGTFYALDPEEGFSQWEYDTTRDSDGLRMYGTQPIHDGLVYVNTWAPDGGPAYLYAVETDGGSTEWRYELGTVDGGGVAPPAVGEEYVFAPDGANGRLLAFELGSHDLAWEKGDFEFGPRNGAAVADCRVVVGSLGGHVTAVDVETGEWAWRSDTRAPVEMPVMVANGTAYAVDADGYLYGFAMSGGAKRFEYRIGSQATTTPRAVDGDLFLASRKTVQRLTGQAGSRTVDSVCGSAESTTAATTDAGTTTGTTSADATTNSVDDPTTSAGGTDDGSGTTAGGSDGSPGFGVVAGASAVAAAAGVALRRVRGDSDEEA